MKKFNKELKNRLEGFESKVEVPEIWAAIEGEVDAINAPKKEKKKRRFFWWFFGLTLLGIFMTTAYFVYKPIESNSIHSLTQQSIQKNKEKEVITSSPKDEELNFKIAQQKNIEQEVATPNPQKEIANNTKTKTFSKEKKDQFNSVSSSTPEYMIESKQREVGLDFSNPIPDNVTTFSGEINETVELLNVTNSLQKIASEDQIIDFQEPKNKPIKTILQANTKLAPIKYISLSLFDLSTDNTETIKEQLERTPSITSPIQMSNWTLMLGVTSGASLINKTFDASSDDSQQLYNNRLLTEDPLEAIHIHTLATLQHMSGWSLQSGFGMTQINERFQGTQETIDSFNYNGITAYRIYSPQDSVAILGELVNRKITRLTKKDYNNYRLYEIPILLGYQFSKDKWGIGIQAGINLNIRLNTKGIALNKEGEFTEIDPTSYKTNIGLGYQFGLNANYQLTNEMLLNIGPKIYLYPQNFMESSSFLQQNYQLFGLQMGVQYKLNR